ncbi:MAG: efflux RND transporter permease subunit [Pseudomonadota bacterium]|nr:efflux RND transporter permease subunit [Pseudomonadota bacterium]MEE3101788.1 efflux RND transporter permease subunit [Pseudomonadota bacterium]
MAPPPRPPDRASARLPRRPGVLGYFVRHNTAANLLMALMLLFGLYGAQNLRMQLTPDIPQNRVQVKVAWDGAGPEQVDGAVIALLVPPLQALDGVDRIRSSAQDGSGTIIVDYEPGVNMAEAGEAASSAVSAVGGLPDGMDRPSVRRLVWTDKVTDVVIHGPVGHDQIGRLATEFSDRLRAAGLARVALLGAPPHAVRVSVPERELVRHDLTVAEVAAAVADAARTDPGGRTASGTRVSTGAERRTIEELGDVVVGADADGERLRLRDIARIEDEGARTGRRYYVGDQAAAVVAVSRNEMGDAVEIMQRVRAISEEMAPTLPAGVRFDFVSSRVEVVEERLALLLDNAATGMALVLAVLFLFLNARTAIWVSAGIPISLLFAAGMMWAFGLSLNLVTLFALILTLGIVVDDAIVVGEHADDLARRRRLSPAAAAEQAARRMAAPVISAGLTTAIAFTGLLAIGGRFGKMLEGLAIVVAMVLLASLVESLLVLPNHMRHALGKGVRGVGTVAGRRRTDWADIASSRVNRGFDALRDRAFRPAVVALTRLRWPALGLAFALLAFAAAQLQTGALPWRFWHSPDRASVAGNIAMLSGAEREDTLAQLRQVERAIEETGKEFEARYGADPVRFVLGQVGGSAGRGLAVEDSKEPWQLASVSVELSDPDERPYSSWEFLGEVQKRIVRAPLTEVVTFRGLGGGPGEDSISIELSGAEAEELKAASEALQQALADYPEVSALEDNLAYDKTELLLEITPLGEAQGLTAEAIGRVLRNRLTGVKAAEFAVEGRTGTITVRLPQEELTADFLARTRILTPSGDWAPLSELVAVSSRPGFGVLRRVDGVMSVTLTGELSEDDPDRAALVERDLRERILPGIAERYDIRYDLSGLAKQERAFLADAEMGFALALAGIYLVLAWVFASWSRPLTVLAVVPFGLVGAVWGHVWMGVPMTLYSVVGLIGMSGIIINDSIVLVTTIDEYARGRALRPALIDAVCDRFRAVTLTTLTTVLGLAPLLTETSSQAQTLLPTVVTLCFGLGFGFFLVLLVTPALVLAQRDVGRALTSARRMTALALGRRRAKRLGAPLG